MHFLDWSILFIYLFGSLAIGVLGRKYISGIEDYLVAGRKLGVHIGIATLAATEIGTITYMYYAELGYKAGFAAFITAIIAGCAMIFIGKTGIIVERLRSLNVMTVPEFFERKYGRGLRILTGALVAAAGILNMGVFLRVEGEFLTILCGISKEYLILAMTFILLLEMTYTALGGMVSVVITDFLQYVLLSTATVLISVFVVWHVGWDSMVDKVVQTFGSAQLNPFTHPKFGWSFIIWQVLVWLAINTCWQTTAMRSLSTNSPQTARRVLQWTGFIFLGRGMLPMLWGIAALTLFGQFGHFTEDGAPVPLVNGATVKPIEAMPYMLAMLLPTGIKGLVAAGMLAATMSVNSSYLLAWSSIISQDIVQPLRLTKGLSPLNSSQQIKLNRSTNVLVSVFLLFFGLYFQVPGSTYLYLNLTATIYLAGAFICILGALYWKKTSKMGCYLSMLFGALGTLIPFFILKWNENHIGFSAFLFAIAGLVLGSYCFPEMKEART